MREIAMKEAAEQMKSVLRWLKQGQEVVLTSGGRPVARMLPAGQSQKRVPDLGKFRASIRLRGEPLSRTVARSRREASY